MSDDAAAGASAPQLLSGPVLYSALRAVYGDPGTPSYEAGDEAIALAGAEAAEDTV